MYNPADKLDPVHSDVRQTVYAAMETGNFNMAGLIMQEYKEEYPAECEALRIQLVRDYGKEV